MPTQTPTLKGYTREIYGSCAEYEGAFLVKPDADLDGVVMAWNVDCQEFDRLNGWLWSFDCKLQS